MTPEERLDIERKKCKKRRYERRKAAKQCVRCGKQDARTLAGHIECEACAAYMNKYIKPKTGARRIHDLEAKRERRVERGEAMLCKDCGRKDYLTLHGKPYCAVCKRKRNEVSKKWRNSGRQAEYQKQRTEIFRENGMCTKCGKQPPEPGRKRCMDCNVRERMYDWKKKAERGNMLWEK